MTTTTAPFVGSIASLISSRRPLVLLIGLWLSPCAFALDETNPPPGSALAPDVPAAANVGATFTPPSNIPMPPKTGAPRIATETAPAPALPVPQVRPPEGLDAPATAVLEDEEPPPIHDVWARIRQGFAMPDLDGPLVEKHEDWYADRPDYVARMIERSRKYLYYIAAEVEKRRMPMEIALLPMIESAFNPRAHSSMKAAGMWQFIPSTGKRYGLKQTFWYDGRRDVISATRAALDYLQALYGQFGDWQLALSAYNWGEGAVARAMAKNRAAGRPTDYLSLKMPDETRNYLPKLQAVKNLITDPESFGFNIESVPNEPYFQAVKVPGQIDVQLAAKLANVSIDEFRNLNPGHSRPVIVSAATKQLLLPADKVDAFQENLENFEKPLVSWQSYRVQRKERLRHVAQKFGLSVAQLCEANSLTLKSRLRPGQLLLVPARNAQRAAPLPMQADHADFAPAPATATKTKGRVVYKVRRGETLFSIARHHGITLAQIKAWNRLKGNHVRVGQSLIVKTADKQHRAGRPHKVALR